MNTKHTPGPWVWRGEVGRSELHSAHGCVIGYAGYEGMWMHSDGDAEANAHLIAAAPEMLAELRNMVRWCGHRGEVLGEDKLLPINQQPPEVQSAMRAIAKAEGEQA